LGFVSEAARERPVQELTALPEEERREVLREARARALRVNARTLPWASLRAAVGLVRGEPADAVEDCSRLYDG